MIFFLHSTFGIYIQHVVHRLAILLVQAVGFFSLKQRSPNSHESCNFTLSNSVLQVQPFSKLPFGNLKQIGCQLQILGKKRALLEISFGRHIDISRFHTPTNEEKRNNTITHCYYYKDHGGQIIFPANVYLTLA